MTIVRTLATGPVPNRNLNPTLAGGMTSPSVLVARRYSISEAGKAKLSCCKMIPVLTRALNAVDEPKYTHPKTNTHALFAISDHTGTPSRGWMRLKNGANTTASSLANDHVSRDAVCIAPEMAKSVTTLSVTRNKVATFRLDVAWYHISRAGKLIL